MGHRHALSEINVTPLIDVLLVLLIIFMVVTPIAARGLDVGLPAPPDRVAPPPPVPAPLVLELVPTGLSLNGLPLLDLRALESRLQDVFATRADRTLYVKAAGGVSYGRVVEAMDVARGCGADRIGLIGQEADLKD